MFLIFDTICTNTTRVTILAAFIAFTFCGGCDESGADDGPSSAGDNAGGATGSTGTSGIGGAFGTSGVSGTDGATSAPRVGGFDVKLLAPVAETNTPGIISVIGKVYDAPPPDDIIWEKTGGEAGCELLEPRVPFCDPPCTGEVCVEDGECVANPTPRDVGTVTVHGLQTAEGTDRVTLVSVSPAAGYQSTDALTYPAFAEGDEIRLEASGGDYEPFTILSSGIVPLELAGEGEIPIEREQPMMLAWASPGQPDIASIRVEVDISHHGAVKGKIECEVPDTGSLQIPAALVTALIDLGYSGFPTVNVMRIAIGSVVIAPGRVELTVQSLVERGITIPGLISCSQDADCPEGQTCQQDLKCI
jgi:hypothetical protein